MISKLKDLDVVILCGGLGTRLQSVIYNQPKILAKIGDTPFLDILLNKISEYNFKNIILCTGHLKEQIKKYVKHHNINIIFSEEETSLGTGGALKNAKSLIKSEHFIVMNGDSICNINFNEFYNFHLNNNALISIVLSNNNNETNDYGNVIIDKYNKIISFNEKTLSNNLLINAGIYLMKKEVFYIMPKEKTFSLEYDFFSKLESYRFYGFVTNNKVIDIGTPERYINAYKFIN